MFVELAPWLAASETSALRLPTVKLDQKFIQEHAVLLLILSHSVIGRTQSSYPKACY